MSSNDYFLMLVVFFILLFFIIFFINIFQVFLFRKVSCKFVLKSREEIFTKKFNKRLYFICVASNVLSLFLVTLNNVVVTYNDFSYSANIPFFNMFYVELVISALSGIFGGNYIIILLSFVVNFTLGVVIFSKYRELQIKEVFITALLFTFIVAPYYLLIPYGLIF